MQRLTDFIVNLVCRGSAAPYDSVTYSQGGSSELRFGFFQFNVNQQQQEQLLVLFV